MPRHLPFLFPWLRVNLLIRSITSRTWDERAWPLEIRRDLAWAPWWN
jgi:hypothetical protein